MLQAAEPRSTQVETGIDSSTGFFCPATEGSKLGDNTLAFSTCCQNRSELIGGCLRINSNKASRSVVIRLTIYRDGLASKLNSPPSSRDGLGEKRAAANRVGLLKLLSARSRRPSQPAAQTRPMQAPS